MTKGLKRRPLASLGATEKGGSGRQERETVGDMEGCAPSPSVGATREGTSESPRPLSFSFAFLCLGNDLFGDEWWGFLVMGKPALKVAPSAGNPV